MGKEGKLELREKKLLKKVWKEKWIALTKGICEIYKDENSTTGNENCTKIIY